MNNPKISIIVPIYNTEKYLHRCIDSILVQTFTDFELLLIDDGSSDKSGEICDEYALKDSRIRVFHKENGGASSARNLGLNNAQGEWITFVDADDWIENDAFKLLIKVPDSDLIIGSMFFEHDRTTVFFPFEGKIEGEKLDLFLTMNIDHSFICGPCAKFFKNEIIQYYQIRFNELLCFGEDSVFVKTYINRSRSIRTVNTLIYYYQDIGDDIYNKYSKSFKPILNYYNEIINVYRAIESSRQISIPKNGVIGVVYNIARICLENNGNNDLIYILKFLKDKNVRTELYKRNSLNVNVQLLLASLPKGYCLRLYVRITTFIKTLIKCKS